MRYIKKNKFTTHTIEWREVKTGARAVRENGKIPVGPGAPMLTMEAETFADMEQRGVQETMTVGNIYQVKP